MGFHDLINRANATSMRAFGNCDVAVLLSGVTVKTMRGIFVKEAEVVSPYDAMATVIKPVLTVSTADMGDVTSEHVLQIKLDKESSANPYRFDGGPRSDGTGFTVIHLQVSKNG